MFLLETAVKYKKPVAKKTAGLLWGVISPKLEARLKPPPITDWTERKAAAQKLASQLIQDWGLMDHIDSGSTTFSESIYPLPETSSDATAHLVGGAIERQLGAAGLTNFKYDYEATFKASEVGPFKRIGYNLPRGQFNPAGPTLVISRLAEAVPDAVTSATVYEFPTKTEVRQVAEALQMTA